MTITESEYRKLTLEEQSQVASMTQREWDKLFPPRSYPEPSDASGYTGDTEVLVF